MYGHDVGVVQLGEEARFASKRGVHLYSLRQGWSHRFHRYFSVQDKVFGQKHFAHTATPNALFDGENLTERSARSKGCRSRVRHVP